ncbi:MAG: hypothetical protein EZS28_027566 [Streblomastix strix]|uniref:Uncharacterized protein n=1 Tax=Streblomastix strix TaxID=222440 RepID=A0A5J4V4C8_9EUKA|nr:MAG: hypothetical protein EZS28_027566 [Streblomastix strix]
MDDRNQQENKYDNDQESRVAVINIEVEKNNREEKDNKNKMVSLFDRSVLTDLGSWNKSIAINRPVPLRNTPPEGEERLNFQKLGVLCGDRPRPTKERQLRYILRYVGWRRNSSVAKSAALKNNQIIRAQFLT